MFVSTRVRYNQRDIYFIIMIIFLWCFHSMLCVNQHSFINYAIKLVYMSGDTQHLSMQSMVSYQRRLMPTALVL